MQIFESTLHKLIFVLPDYSTLSGLKTGYNTIKYFILGRKHKALN